ncbi:restriction endonuclease [Nitrosomonas sp.]|uniref:restriction endonuclease n=1 Tax=Nitrosomonas sp. TaxID=42353 RepID=UPI001D2F6DFF|nr:restriction endonuclease [Nitrosomonas sp.]MCB1947882.1 restriction endonuclease [Nitrosomonas sp.]
MSIPDFQSCMLPMLSLAADCKEHSISESREVLAEHFGLTESERSELLPSGRQRRFDNRVAWAKVYLEQAGLLKSSRRAHFSISEDGLGLIAKKPTHIDISLLENYSKFQEFRAASRKADNSEVAKQASVEEFGATPEEALEQAYQSIRTELASELLQRVKASSSQFFEGLVVELLLKMGYGRNRTEAGQAIGRSGDEGIDGIISEDRLGLETIYIQAKRWEGTVGRPEVQKFVGALHGKRAKKGVFLTTGVFSNEAKDYVSHIDPRVVLIDGRELAEYMLDLDLGVTPKANYEVKRIDSDYFSDE